MLRTTISFVLLLLAGCAPIHGHLVSPDGKRHPMQFDRSARKVTADIEGVQYSGIYAPTSGGATAGFVGSKPVFAASDGNFGQAMLLAKTGDTINCEFMVASGPTVLGQCKGKNGRDYTLTTE